MNMGLPGINKIYRLYIAYRKMLNFHWMPSQKHHDMYTTGALDICIT